VIRERTADEIARLPAHLKQLDVVRPYPVEIAPALAGLAAQVDARAG
jgi:hypothetical protein